MTTAMYMLALLATPYRNNVKKTWPARTKDKRKKNFTEGVLPCLKVN